MKKLGIAVAITLFLFMSVPAWAANVVQQGDGFIYVKLDASSNFVWTTSTFTTGKNAGVKVSTVFPNGLALTAIKSAAAAAAGSLVVRMDSATGPIISRLTSIDGGVLKDYFDGKTLYKIYITNADQTTPTNAEAWFEFSNKPTQ